MNSLVQMSAIKSGRQITRFTTPQAHCRRTQRQQVTTSGNKNKEQQQGTTSLVTYLEGTVATTILLSSFSHQLGMSKYMLFFRQTFQ